MRNQLEETISQKGDQHRGDKLIRGTKHFFENIQNSHPIDHT